MPPESIPSIRPFPAGAHDLVARIPSIVREPVIAAAMLAVLGAIGLAAHEPLLFASLGPTASLAARKPRQRSTTFHNIFVGR